MKRITIIVTVVITSILVLPLALYFGFLFLAHDCNPDSLKIDSCLDAGGKWDYENRVGIFEDEPIPGGNRDAPYNPLTTRGLFVYSRHLVDMSVLLSDSKSLE